MSFRLDAFWCKTGHVLEMVVYPVCNGVGAARREDFHGGDAVFRQRSLVESGFARESLE